MAPFFASNDSKTQNHAAAAASADNVDNERDVHPLLRRGPLSRDLPGTHGSHGMPSPSSSTASGSAARGELLGSNPAAIPTAGGVPLGHEATKKRRLSQSQLLSHPLASSSSSAPSSSASASPAASAITAFKHSVATPPTPTMTTESTTVPATSSPSSSTPTARKDSTGEKENRRSSKVGAVMGSVMEKLLTLKEKGKEKVGMGSDEGEATKGETQQGAECEVGGSGPM